MPKESLVNSFIGRFMRPSHRTPNRGLSPLRADRVRTGTQKGGSGSGSSGSFNHAKNFVVNQLTMVDHVIENQVIVNNIATGKTVLEHLTPYTNLDAVMDSSARDPPPSCHPGTRLRIGDRLANWVDKPGRQWSLTWLHGPAGTGKSAVAQTFAEQCSEKSRLGAAFFFSRPNDRSDPDCVIPTLAYQLAVNHPKYKALLTSQLVNDPQLLRRSLRVQFKKLIVEPFSVLQLQEDESVREPLIIVLDGLDECEGEEVQCEFIEMISEAIRLKKDLPLLWLICSRPEPHLKYIFSRADFTIDCTREELVIDDESRADVNKYLRDGFAEIKIKFWDVTDPMWPSEEEFIDISSAADGLFIFASTAIRYIGDSAHADPMARLYTIISFLKDRVRTAGSPLEPLDLLYSRVLNDISDDVLPVTKRILACFIHAQKNFGKSLHAQILSNFLNIDQRSFYRALRKLHSVIDVPTPETALTTSLRFYHASFEDYLLDADRSGKFALQEQSAMIDIARSCLSWYKTDLLLFHYGDNVRFGRTHEHDYLPNLKWVSPDNNGAISTKVVKLATKRCWAACCLISEPDEDLLSQIYAFDFRYIQLSVWGKFEDFAGWLFKQDPSGDTIRTEPANEVDLQLMAYMGSMAKGEPAPVPAAFPVDLITYGEGNPHRRYYFFVGHGSKACIFWMTKGSGRFSLDMLNCDSEPSESVVSEHIQWLTDIGWIQPDSAYGAGESEQKLEV